MFPRITPKRKTAVATLPAAFQPVQQNAAPQQPVRRSQSIPYSTIESHVWKLIPNDSGGPNDCLNGLFQLERASLDRIQSTDISRNSPQEYFVKLLKKALKNSFGTGKESYSLSVYIPRC
jgi:hypothetical protein